MQSRAAIVLDLLPDTDEVARLEAVTQRFNEALLWVLSQPLLEETHNVVALQRALYGSLKQRFALPAQYILLCLRKAAGMHHRGMTEADVSGDRVPLDQKTFAVKGADRVSIATLDGRLLLRAVFLEYDPAFASISGSGALIRAFEAWTVRFHVDLPGPLSRDLPREKPRESSRGLSQGSAEETQWRSAMMLNETVLGRVGRLIAGVTHAAVSAVEGTTAPSVLEQNLREVEATMTDLRREASALEAERGRLELRIRDLEAESLSLEDKIELAVSEGREDLARSGLGRQEDIMAMIDALRRRQLELDREVQESVKAASALKATQDQLARDLEALRAGGGAPFAPIQEPGLTAAQRAQEAAERAMTLSDRLSGSRAAYAQPHLEELDALHRERRIDRRLEEIRQRLSGDNGRFDGQDD